MSRIRVKLNELQNADVKFISLVDRSASRIPIRTTKGAKDMGIDLTSILKSTRKSETVAPTIESISIQTQADATLSASVQKAITDAGFKVDKASKNESGTITTFSQVATPSDAKDLVLIRLSDNVVVAMKGFQPGHPALQDGDFKDQAGANSFYQGVDSSLDVLFSTICKSLQDSPDEATAAKVIGTKIDGFKNYTLGLVKALPTAAFKMDLGISDAVEKFEKALVAKGNVPDLMNLLDTAPTGFLEPEWSAMSPVDKIKWYQANSAKKVETPAAAIKCEKCEAAPGWAEMSAETKATTHDAHKEATVKVDPPAVIPPVADNTAVLAAIAAISTKVDGVVATVASVAEKQEAQKIVVDALVTKSETLSTTLGTMVSAPPVSPDTPSGRVTPVAKVDDDPRTGCFDTAFIRKGNRVTRAA